MGLISWRNAPDGKIIKADVSVAKNDLSIGEMQELNEPFTMYPTMSPVRRVGTSL